MSSDGLGLLKQEPSLGNPDCPAPEWVVLYMVLDESLLLADFVEKVLVNGAGS